MLEPTRSDSLAIAVVSSPWYPTPPVGYGGVEIVCHLLHTMLRRLGHRVTVFGSEGSPPEVIALAAADWSDDLGTRWSALRNATYLTRVHRLLKQQRFDVIHDHSGYDGVSMLPVFREFCSSVVHTMHNRIDKERPQTFYREVHEDVRLVAISQSQAQSAPGLRVAAVVHNAVDVDSFRISPQKAGYLIELARICPPKGQHLAIEVARRTGRRLILAGKVPASGEARDYFEQQIAPHLGDQVTYFPNVYGKQKSELLADAVGGIFPLGWPEPFGLAMVECMVSGTPVIALANGAATELIEHGVTGFLANDVDGLVQAVDRLHEIDPMRCAQVARARFNPELMAKRYLGVYYDAIGSQTN